MPYSNEKAYRLGHVPTVNNEAVQKAFARWQVAHSSRDDHSSVTSLCVPVSDLASAVPSDAVTSAITVDGSDSEVEATRQHPTVKVGYLRVAGSLVDLDKLAELTKPAGEHEPTKSPFVDARAIRRAHNEYAFDAAFPGSGLVLPCLSGAETWRNEVDGFLSSTRFDDGSHLTLADVLLTIHGKPGLPATEIKLRACPACRQSTFPAGNELYVSRNGGTCTLCGAQLYLADVLRSYEEYAPEGSNLSPLTRVMLIAERLMIFGYLDHLYTTSDSPKDVLRQTLFITDGPLALFGVVAPLKRRLYDYLQELYRWSAIHGISIPLMVGVEKSGRFVEHAELISDLIPEGNVMRLTTDYINRITGRPDGNEYGTDEFYGRRFIYRTTSGDPLVITVPPATGVLPYSGRGDDDFASYPTLRTICEVLDSIRTRLYPNAVIPVALAHSAASLPLGVGHSVLRALAQKGVGLPSNSQVRYRSPFP